MNDNDARAARLSARWDMVAASSNRAYDLADRQEGTPVGQRAAELSETLADRLDDINDQISAL